MTLKLDYCYHGHVLDVLRGLPDECVQMVVTSPPYWGLRDYGTPPQAWSDGWTGSFGLEPTPELYVAHITEIFREVRRVLRADGTLWLNLGDSYAANRSYQVPDSKYREVGNHMGMKARDFGLKPKDRVGIPHMVAFALRADGWYWRDEIVWHKRSAMPESVTDRCTKSHEFVFMFSKRERYFYDYAAIEEPATGVERDHIEARALGASDDQKHTPTSTINGIRAKRSGNKERKPASARGVPVDTGGSTNGRVAGSIPWEGTTRRKRSVWSLSPDPFPEAHFATFPKTLPTICILAGSRPGDVVLDPFMGSGTTATAAQSLGRAWVGIELSEEYMPMQNRRTKQRGLAL